MSPELIQPSRLRRPVGVSLTAAWLGLVLAVLLLLSAVAGRVIGVLFVAAVAAAMSCVIVGLWRGRKWADRTFRFLLAVSLAASVLQTAIPGRGHSRWFFAVRAVYMATWLWCFHRENVRAWFEDAGLLAKSTESTTVGT